ncbi:MAG: WGR domain-containing protein [Saprospiraceae bacterium]
MKRYFTFKDGKSDKFWSIETAENKVTVLFGKTGTAGVANEKDFDSPESAQKEAENLIREKVKKRVRRTKHARRWPFGRG